MRRRLLVALLAAGLAVVAACSESDQDLDSSAETTTSTAPDDDGGDDDRDGDDASEDGDGVEAEARAGVVDLLAAQGLPDDLAECAVDEVLAEGFTLEELEAEMAAPSQDLLDALGRAGAACVTPEDLSELPQGSLDLNDPMARDQFVKNFAASSGLSREVADCVADELIATDFDLGRLGNPGDPEVQAVIQDAVAACS